MVAIIRSWPSFVNRRRPHSFGTQLLKLVLVGIALNGSAVAYETGRASFSVRVNDEITPYEVFALYVLPGERLELEAIGTIEDYQITGDGDAQPTDANRWTWTAPREPGLYEVRVSSADDSVQLNVFVLIPGSRVADGYLMNYRMGSYPATPLNDNPVYLAPDGFLELNDRTASVKLSPHFELSQFPSKQAGNLPKYLALRERLFLKLELLLEQVNVEGFPAETLTIMSGYRTPFYNQAIGNVPYSRHVYGGAADIFVDVAPRDGVMDDLNSDGIVDFRDAQTLYRIANRLFASESNRWLIGGLGVYRRNSAHGPFLHIDARGSRSRWGLIP